jgi:tetratricopeptide (TPR) repeat protein
LKRELQQRGASASLSEKLNVIMQEGQAADAAKNYDVAREKFKKAVRLADQLQAHDARLATALSYLGAEYMTTDLTAASEAFGREMKVDAELYGEQSPELVKPLEMLGEAANKQKDYTRAFDYFSRAVELNRKAYGEASEATALTLIALSRVYLAQKQYDKAEPYLLEARKIGESVFGHGEAGMMTIQGALCAFYDQWGVPEKSLKCYQDLEPMLEKRYGGNPIPLLWSLQPEAVALRSLGRTQEAEKVEARIREIEASAKAN